MKNEMFVFAAEATLSAFDKYDIDGELIIVDDGSTDKTAAIISEIQKKDRRVSILRRDKPRGIGASFLDGVQQGKKDYVTIVVGDNENDPIEIMRNYYLADSVDIIVPFIYNIEVRSYIRRLISSIYRFIVNISFGCNFNYTNGTVIYNRDILKNISLYSKGFFYQAELLVRLIRNGYLYAEVPQMLSQRTSGKSKALTLKSFLNVLKDFLHLIWLVHIKRNIGQTTIPTCKNSATYRRSVSKAE
jgi:dolichol-phosphate mannosyltransferase